MYITIGVYYRSVFEGVSSIGCLLKGFSVTWVTDIGVSVKGVFL